MILLLLTNDRQVFGIEHHCTGISLVGVQDSTRRHTAGRCFLSHCDEVRERLDDPVVASHAETALEFFHTHVAYWNSMDVSAITDSMLEDAEFVSSDGAWIRGRENIASKMSSLPYFQANGPFVNTTMHLIELQTRLLFACSRLCESQSI